MNKSQDLFTWEVAVPNATYRIWQNISCSIGSGVNTFTSNSTDYPPPYTQNYVRWTVSVPSTICIVPGTTITLGGNTTCYSRIRNGTVGAGQQITLDPSNVSTLMNGAMYILIVDANEIDGSNQSGTQVSTFFLGDPCQSSAWKSELCDISSSYTSTELSDPNYLKMATSGMLGAMQSIQTMSGLVTSVAGNGQFASLWSPTAAGYAYLYLTEQLPSIMFPVAMAIFTLVISVMIFVSSFRSISGILKGETKIAEIGRLV